MAGLAESPEFESVLGATFHCLIKEQFERSRDGDRFFYQNSNVFTEDQRKQIEKTSLARVMCDNLKGTNSYYSTNIRLPSNEAYFLYSYETYHDDDYDDIFSSTSNYS